MLLISASVRIHAEPEVNAPISPDLFGGLVDIVTPGYQHWNAESGDRVDPTGDGDDFDNNFGEHKGRLDVVKLSRKTREYAQGTVDDESVYADSASSLSWVFKVPGGGKYVFATRFWRELQDTTNVQVSYQSRGKWIALPLIEKVEHWGGFSDLSCFLIEAPNGRKEIPFRVKALSGRAQIHRMLLGKMRDESPFVSDKRPVHPSMHFTSGDIGRLRQKVKNGPPKLAFDYMTQQMNWYTNTLNRGEKSWTPKGASHHVPRSIAQTAFMYVLTERQEYFDTALRMMQTVMDWEVNENAIVDQKGAYNILGRGRVLSAMAMAYDWLYDKLSSRKRRRIRRHLDAEANRLFLYNETVVGNSSSNNWDPWIGAGYGMAGIALRDEHRWAGDWMASMKRIYRVNLHHSGEDFGYFNSGLIKSLDFGISLKTATGEDIFTDEKERLNTLLDYRTMLLEPLGKSYAQFGDARGSNDPLLSLCLATCFEDPLAQWFIKHRSAGTADQMKSWAWNHMLPIAVVTLYDPLMKEAGPNLPRPPAGLTC